jgi:hypothetical protein
MDKRRRQLLKGAGALASIVAVEVPSFANPVSTARTINVMDYGAKGDGIYDDTDAFNKATQSAALWTDGLAYNILVPTGRYRIDGTIYLRKGQTLAGDGHASMIDASKAKGRTLVMGSQQITAGSKQDPGGAPVRISTLRFLGGAGDAPLIEVNAAGFSINDLFITSPGIGISISGSDGILSNIEIDQSLNGIVLLDCQNLVVSNINFYSPRFAITIGASCRDIAISNCVFAYPEYTAILFADGATDVRTVKFANCIFTRNIQHESFLSYILSRGQKIEAQFSACTFRNWSEFVVDQQSGSVLDFSFHGCTFDGARTNDGYHNGQAKHVLRTGEKGSFYFADCRFRNVSKEIVVGHSDFKMLTFEGGIIENCPSARLSIKSSDRVPVSIRNVLGFVLPRESDRHIYVQLPCWVGGPEWRISVACFFRDSRGQLHRFLDQSIYSVSTKPGSTDGLAVIREPLFPETELQAIELSAEIELSSGSQSEPRGRSGSIIMRVALPRRDIVPESIEWNAETFM